ELATAETLAAAEPEATATEKFVVAAQAPQPYTPPTPRPSKGNGQKKATAPAARTEAAAPKTPTRIPFQLSPTGTDVPAPERVPASRGPSVPNGASPAAPTRIPFKLAVPAEDLTEKAEPWLTKDNFAGEPASPEPVVLSSPASQNTISLPLLPILQSLLPVQLAGDASDVPESARIEFPAALLEPQLAKGRVSVSPTEFASCLPEKYRSLFKAEATEASVALPLHEVLKNLPSAALQMRSDQVEDERGRDFATPFSAKADEDAKRFEATTAPETEKRKAAPAPAPAPVKTPVPVVAKETLAPIARVPAPVPAPVTVIPSFPEPVKRSALQEMLKTDDEVDARKAIEYVGQLAGVKACAVHFRDGLSLAGKLPDELGVEGLSAMAPSLLLKIENHMSESTLGPLQTMTLCCAQGAISFFTHGNLCLTALHEKAELASETRVRVTEVVRELSVNYSQPL
ncbi:MAG: roadblock/LC7 domain-containing protein, partial [Chthoniobacterales bacterium]